MLPLLNLVGPLDLPYLSSMYHHLRHYIYTKLFTEVISPRLNESVNKTTYWDKLMIILNNNIIERLIWIITYIKYISVKVAAIWD